MPLPGESAEEMLIRWAGGVENIGKNTSLGREARRGGVPRSAEFRRVQALPRRRWEDAADLSELTALLTQWLRPPGYAPNADTVTLRPLQAAALREAHDVKGLFAPIAVGKGKSLISLLAPTAMKAERPLLVVPPRLKKKACREQELYAAQFRIHPGLRIFSYHDLSRAKFKDLLWELRPDLIVLDECNKLKAGSARTSRVADYLKDAPQTMVVAMSGTVTKRSLRDFHHIIHWCLKDTLCPLPLQWPILQDWCDAVDSLKGKDAERRMAPGVLAEFCTPKETVRQGLQRRIAETPGVIRSLDTENDVGASLVISDWGQRLPDELHAAMSKLRDEWETPNGDICMEAVDVWRHARELSSGFCYRWDPPAPREWLEARKEWHAFVRDILKRGKWNGERADSLLLISNLCERMASPPHEYTAWTDIRHTFTPNTVAEWRSYDVVEAAARWLNDPKKPPGICWVEHVETQKVLSKMASVPLFGAGNDDIEAYTGPCVASIASQGEGKNLQQYSRYLILTPPPAGDTWEQLLGRSHRSGKNPVLGVAQEADEVTAEVHLPCVPLQESFRQALADARYLEEIQGVSQKLRYADMLVRV